MAVGRIKDIEKKKTKKSTSKRRKRTTSTVQKGIKRVARDGQIRKVKSHSRSKTSAKKN